MSTTWSSTGRRSVKAVVTTGSEAAPAAPVKATNTVAFATAVAGNTVTIRGMTFTAIANGTTPANTQQFAVGAGGSANTDTGTAFAAAVNANRGILAMTAVNASGTVTLTADEYGTGPNAWTATKVGTPITLGGATFANGVDIVGVNLADVGWVMPFFEATAGQTVASGNLLAYLLNERCGLYSRVVGLDVAISATAARCHAGVGFEVRGRRGYLVWLPNGVTISSGNATVWHNATALDGTPL